MTISTGNIETADLDGLSKFALARIISTWNQNARAAHNFIRAVAHAAIVTIQKRAAGEAGEMVMDLSGMSIEGRAELLELAGRLREEALIEGNTPAVEFFARIIGTLEAEAQSRLELEKLFALQ